MCIAIPWTVVESETFKATVERQGERREVDTSLVGETTPGDILLIFRHQAIRKADPSEVPGIEKALTSLAMVLEGTATQETIDYGMDNLGSGEPELPAHLQAMVGKKVL